MKTVSPSTKVCAVVLLAIAVTASHSAQGQQSFDFNPPNDNINGWLKFDLSAAGLPPAQITFPADGFGGKGVRVVVPAPPSSAAGPARAIIYRTNEYYDFYASVDVVTFSKAPADGSGLNQAFGILFRLGNIGLGTTTGYVMNYDPRQAAGARGQFQINRVTSEAAAGTIAAANITLEADRSYRMVATGVGTILTGQLYDLEDLTTPLVTIQADEGTYPNGVIALLAYFRGGSGDITNPLRGFADVTWDNYYAASNPPPSVAAPGTPNPRPNYPQVTDRAPVSFSNFYSAAGGISFNATALGTNTVNTNAIRLILNGADVSSGLAISGTTSNAHVTYGGLISNRVYDARIELQDASGTRRSTNSWTFDTFVDATLETPPGKTIEVEDYNYQSGNYQLDPIPVSGFDDSFGQVNGSPDGWATPGIGYLDAPATADVDYFDLDGGVGSGISPEFRLNDRVGTQQGSGTSDAQVLPAPPAPLPINDTRRQKYAVTNMGEYQVRRTQATEWMNYTRSFTPTNYNVYLRVACRAPQPVTLDLVGGDPTTTSQTTTPLGTFFVPSTTMTILYRYVPLMAAGNRAVINLSGTNTLRLTMGGSVTNATQYMMSLNYLVFVPTSAAVTSPVVLESAAAVNGPYSPAAGAAVNLSAKTITVPASGNAAFYRIRSDSVTTITSISKSGGNAVITYN
jgi:hypothetical protein